MYHVVVRSTLRLGLLASFVLVVLSACGGGGAKEGGAKAGGESQATTEQTEAEARLPGEPSKIAYIRPFLLGGRLRNKRQQAR
jgi:hypothetical protein